MSCHFNLLAQTRFNVHTFFLGFMASWITDYMQVDGTGRMSEREKKEEMGYDQVNLSYVDNWITH